MACTYRFTGTDGKQVVIKGQAAFKAFLADGGLEQLRGEAAPKFSRQQKLPELTPQDVLQPDTIAAAKDAITKYKKAEGPDPLTTEERALGESLLQPAFEAAKNNKPGFDAVLDKVAEKVGGYAKKPGIKKMQRAVTKLATEQEWKVDTMKDLLRGTIVVSTFEEAQEAINEIGKVYTFDRIKNRLSADMVDPDGKTLPGKPLPTGYQDILTNVVLEDGTVAEIQISTPEMIAAKNLGHEVYAFEREMPNSPVKTRMVDLQKKIYSEGLGAYEGRAANLLKTRANSAASIGSPFSRTSEGLRGLGSGTQAVAERQSGATVTGTSATSKNIVPGGKDLKSNFIGTSKQSIPENEPAGKAAPKLSRKQGSVLDRIPALETAAQGLKEGTVTREQYDKLVNKLKPVTPYAEVPAPATVADMERGLASDKVERIGVPSETLKAGDPVGLRLDIPAYANHGVWVVSVHEQEAGYAAGKSIGYESVAAVTKPTFGVVEKAALAIAGGKPKATIAVMKGDWKPITPKQASATAKMAMKNDNWVQVGMDPTRHAYFYDRENMEPVVSADEAVQIGPLVLAKNPVYGKKSDFAFSKRQEIRDAADAIAKMDPDVRDDTEIGNFPGAATGYMLYEARVLLKKPSEKLKRVNENNSFELWNNYDFIANVDGEHFGIAKQEDPDEPDDETKFVYSFAPLDDPNKGVTTVTDQTDELFKEMRASLGEAPAFSQRQPMGRATEGWIFSRDEVGRFRFGAGAKAYRLAADVANNVLDRLGLKPVSPELGRAMRKMKAEVERAQRLTVTVAEKMKDLTDQERQMISDVIEGELKRGVKPPKHVLLLAASLQSIMSEQSSELVRLGMLSPEAAGRWDGKYLPRFYEQKLGDEVKAWAKAAKSLLGRKKTMQGIGGSSLKSRGMFELINTEDLQDWLDEGWEVRDAEYDPAVDETVTVWRDYTRQERDDMGEIRDAMFRFVMGYNKSQRDIALGRLYESLAANYASKKEKPGYVKVPDSKVEDTMARRYGKLGGMWVPPEVLDHLSAFDQTQQNELLKMYLKGLSLWKEGKTVLNPVSHANNVLSNLTMAHFAGISYWDIGKYAAAMRDLIKKTPMVEEALDAGLFGGTFNQAELLDQMPPQLKALAGMSESRLKRGVDTTWNALSWFIRKPAASAYQAEDQFFRYLIYRDARLRGLDVEDAIDYSQNYIFTYDDLPKTARGLRDFALPFFAYTYKVVPPLVNTALEKPWRYAAPAAALYTVNALMYAMAASLGGGEDEDWWTVIRRYVTDPEFRDKARAMEEQERENLPPWMKGYSATLATPKAIRLGMDDVTNLPLFLDVSRVFPGGDLLDAHANAGGVPLLQPITPSNPVLNTLGVMLWNKDSFFGKDIVDATDTSAEAAGKRAKWAWQQFSPAVAVGNYHWDRALNVIANQTGQPILGYTGINKDGLPAQLGYTAAQTVGIKIRPIDLELSAAIKESEQKRLARDLDTKIRKIERLEKKGAITGEAAETEIEKLKEKKQFLKEGLTVEGEERK